MKRISPRALSLAGFVLIFAPMIIQGIGSAHDKERVAEFYRQNPNNAPLPAALKPSDFAGYHWACFGIGVSLLFTGIRDSKPLANDKPEAWSHAEV